MGYKPRGTELVQWQELTPMQQEVGLLLMRGELDRSEMADRLAVSVRTIDSHRGDLLARLQLNSVVQLVHFGLRNRLIKVVTTSESKQLRESFRRQEPRQPHWK
jgi:DNA-binding CsgD family transcriptional regulator